MEDLGPQSVTDHENGRGAGLCVFVGERPSKEGRYAQGFECAGGDRGAGKFLGAIDASEMDLAVDQAEYVVEGVVLLFELNECRGGKAPCSELFGGKNSESREAFGIFVRIGLKQNAIDDAEDGCGGANAESESENGDGGEAGILAELSNAV